MTPRAKRISVAAGIAASIAIPAEGLRQIAYYDPVGILTVCYGSTANVIKGKKYTLDECDGRLSKEMLEAIEVVDTCHPGLPVPVLAAFGDAVFNSGPKVACNTKQSTAARMLEAGDLAGACNQLPRWNKANVGGVMVPLPGLTKRRNKERDVCLTYLY